MMSKEEIFALKEEIEKAKPEISELKGEKKAILAQLKKDWGCDSVKDVDVQIKQFEKQLKQLEVEKDEAIKHIESEYE